MICNEKRLHGNMVKAMCSSSRVTITFLCGFGFTVCPINVSRVINIESSPLNIVSWTRYQWRLRWFYRLSYPPWMYKYISPLSAWHKSLISFDICNRSLICFFIVRQGLALLGKWNNESGCEKNSNFYQLLKHVNIKDSKLKPWMERK